MTGATVAHYRITEKLGEGGMGAVYRAQDTKLGRDVAIKVLPPALANDADYIARFQREAQVLASLNHPNIAAIYGLEENAIVMELVEGAEPKGLSSVGPTVLAYISDRTGYYDLGFGLYAGLAAFAAFLLVWIARPLYRDRLRAATQR